MRATVGHIACQRVFWLCHFAGEAGAVTTPFPYAARNCPGDDDLEHPWVHTRGEIIQKLFTHDAYHCGELSQTLGIAGLRQIELWERYVEAP